LVSARAGAAVDYSRALWSFNDVRGDAVASTRWSGSLQPARCLLGLGARLRSR